MPDLIKAANEKLVLAGVGDCYDLLNQNEQDLKEITQWIEQTRMELKKRILLKQEKEEINTKITSYMHNLLGSYCMEFFDRQNGA